MQTRNEKIVLTGGHAATTALATIESLKKDKEVNWNISWIGSRVAVEGQKALTLEFREFPKLGIDCHNIIAGRIQRRFTRYGVLSLAKIPFGFVHAFYLLLKIRPKVILSFGGFAAFPIVFVGWLMRIPVIMHEQTIAIGLANKYSIPFVTKIALSREESQKYFPKEKSVLIGNPVRSEFYSVTQKKKIGNPPTILATGGSRGSQNFNKLIRAALLHLLSEFKIIHQTGDLDFESFKEFREELPQKLKKHYDIHNSIPVNEMFKFFDKADIIIGRSGANTVAEVIAVGRPAIFVPIPWSQHDEQMKNALLAKKSGLAKIINQETGTPELLISYINEVHRSWSKMVKNNNKKIYELDKTASFKLAKLCKEMLK